VGITIVVVFAIMLLSGSLEEASEMHSISQLHLRLNRGLAFAISLLTFLVLAMAYGFHSHGIQPRIRNLVELGQGARSDLAMQEVTTRIGQHMMSEHLLAFELMSVLLLVAFVSAIAIAKRKVSYGEEEPAA
jgi:NADH:ubiquinone oxidoreductase subunit 6 (subunit J)